MGKYPELEWLSLRRDGHSAALIAQRAGVTEAVVLRATSPYGPFPRPARQRGRVVTSPEDVERRTARWVALRQAGMRVSAIAAHENVAHQLVSRTTLPYGPFRTPN